MRKTDLTPEFAARIEEDMQERNSEYQEVEGNVSGMLKLIKDDALSPEDIERIKASETWRNFFEANKRLLSLLASEQEKERIDRDRVRKQRNIPYLKSVLEELEQKQKATNRLQYYNIRLASSTMTHFCNHRVLMILLHC